MSTRLFHCDAPFTFDQDGIEVFAEGKSVPA
jgi:hypothetical protein